MTRKEKTKGNQHFSKIAIERIKMLLSDINSGLKIEDFTLSDSFIEFKSIQDALNYFEIANSEKLTDFGSWEELSNKHILFMF